MKRRLSALLLVLVLLTSLLSGCGSKQQEEKIPSDPVIPDTPTEEQTQEEPENRSVIGLAWQSDAELHPYTSTSVTNQAIMSLIYEGLFLVTANFEAEALLCKSCAVSDTGLLWYFEIRDDIKFSDGTKLTSEDVIASLEAARNSSIYRVRFRAINRVKAYGDYGITVALNYPNENLPLLLDLPIVKAATVSNPVPLGTGAFVMQGDKLIRNKNWWQDTEHIISADTIQLIEANEPLDVRNAFEFGGADLAYVDTSATTMSSYHSDNERWGCATTIMEYLGFSQSSKYFSSAELRAAVSYAVDRSTIVSSIYDGFGVEASIPCAPQATFYDNGLADSYAFDLARFNELLTVSGISPDPANPVELIVSAANDRRVETAYFIAEQLTALGLFTEVKELDYNQFQNTLYTGDFDMYLADIRLVPTLDLDGFFYSGSGCCYGGMESSNMRELCRNAMENSGNYYDLHREVMRRGMLCPIFFKTYALYATRGVMDSHTPSVSNLFLSGTGIPVSDILSDEPYVYTEPPADSEENE